MYILLHMFSPSGSWCRKLCIYNCVTVWPVFTCSLVSCHSDKPPACCYTWLPCLSLPGAGLTSVCHHACLGLDHFLLLFFPLKVPLPWVCCQAPPWPMPAYIKSLWLLYFYIIVNSINRKAKYQSAWVCMLKCQPNQSHLATDSQWNFYNISV